MHNPNIKGLEFVGNLLWIGAFGCFQQHIWLFFYYKFIKKLLELILGDGSIVVRIL